MIIKKIEVAETPYLYVDGAAPMDPELISNAIDKAFERLMGFMQTGNIEPAGPPMAVYHDYDPNQMIFRAGIPICEDNIKKASGKVKADALPGGDVHTFTHVGPYSTLRDTYEAAERELAQNGKGLGIPTWEVYVNNPAETSEKDLRTDVFSIPVALDAA